MDLTVSDKRLKGDKQNLLFFLPRSTKRQSWPSLFFTWRNLRSRSSCLCLLACGLSHISPAFAGFSSEAARVLLSVHNSKKLHKVMTAENINMYFLLFEKQSTCHCFLPVNSSHSSGDFHSSVWSAQAEELHG